MRKGFFSFTRRWFKTHMCSDHLEKCLETVGSSAHNCGPFRTHGESPWPKSMQYPISQPSQRRRRACPHCIYYVWPCSTLWRTPLKHVQVPYLQSRIQQIPESSIPSPLSNGCASTRQLTCVLGAPYSNSIKHEHRLLRFSALSEGRKRCFLPHASPGQGKLPHLRPQTASTVAK